jgi:hypothetical protein
MCRSERPSLVRRTPYWPVSPPQQRHLELHRQELSCSARKAKFQYFGRRHALGSPSTEATGFLRLPPEN